MFLALSPPCRLTAIVQRNNEREGSGGSVASQRLIPPIVQCTVGRMRTYKAYMRTYIAYKYVRFVSVVIYLFIKLVRRGASLRSGLNGSLGGGKLALSRSPILQDLVLGAAPSCLPLGS